jgi:beta-glucanase (GH16 family)
VSKNMTGNVAPSQVTGLVLCLWALVFTMISGLSCGSGSNSTSGLNSTGGDTLSSWTLTWSDEFNRADGSAPDSSKWSYDLGGDGWGNGELETYTSRPQNVQIQGGNLVITAMQEDYVGSDGILRPYTSARIQTHGKFSQQYGRFEARIKLPAGRGVWPAFWLLGDNIDTVSWPDCGELDIMENIGNHPKTVYSTVHGPKTDGSAYRIGDTYDSDRAFSDDFHVFAMEWEPDDLRFYVDGNLYSELTRASLPSNDIWVFDHPFFIVLNVAVGGVWSGPPDGSTVFPQSMLVDYVRVYTHK